MSASQVLLSIAAVASLALGVCLDFNSNRPEGGLPVGCAEGIAIIVVILIVIIVISLNNWQKQKKIRAFNKKNEEHLVKVIRDGGERQIHAREVVVGDVVLFESGDIIPCDGVFLSGHNVLCDESSATRMSDSIKKLPYGECIDLRDKRLTELGPDGPSGDGEFIGRADCFIVSGSKVLEGMGTYVVITVGTQTLNARIMKGLFIALTHINVP
jgi:Ca2+-transporting ATPase